MFDFATAVSISLLFAIVAGFVLKVRDMSIRIEQLEQRMRKEESWSAWLYGKINVPEQSSTETDEWQPSSRRNGTDVFSKGDH